MPAHVSNSIAACAPARTCAPSDDATVSAHLASRAWAVSGSEKSRPLIAEKDLLPPPSTRYVASVNGAPAKPMRATSRGSSRRTRRTASITNGVASSAEATRSDSTSARVRTSRSSTGPGWNSTGTPIAGSGTRMSENRMAASTPRRRTGWSVISQASSGVRHEARKSCRSRSSRYSGRYRPAWRMIQVGVRSTASPAQARRKRGASARRGAPVPAAAGRDGAVEGASGKGHRQRGPRRLDRLLHVRVGVRRGQEVRLELGGGEGVPALEHGVEEVPEAGDVAPGGHVPVGDLPRAEEERPHGADARDAARVPRGRDRLGEPRLERGAEPLEPVVQARVALDLPQLREPRGHRERVAGQRAGLVDRALGRDLGQEVGPSAVGAHRQPGADDLSERREVGPDAVPLLRSAPRDAEARHHL